MLFYEPYHTFFTVWPKVKFNVKPSVSKHATLGPLDEHPLETTHTTCGLKIRRIVPVHVPLDVGYTGCLGPRVVDASAAHFTTACTVRLSFLVPYTNNRDATCSTYTSTNRRNVHHGTQAQEQRQIWYASALPRLALRRVSPHTHLKVLSLP